MADPKVLIRRWIHSHEEDGEETKVYRPEGSDLPPSRGREAFELREDGSCLERSPGPSDVPEGSGGSWELEGERLRIRGGRGERNLQIVSAEADKLVVRE